MHDTNYALSILRFKPVWNDILNVPTILWTPPALSAVSTGDETGDGCTFSIDVRNLIFVGADNFSDELSKKRLGGKLR